MVRQWLEQVLLRPLARREGITPTSQPSGEAGHRSLLRRLCRFVTAAAVVTGSLIQLGAALFRASYLCCRWFGVWFA